MPYRPGRVIAIAAVATFFCTSALRAQEVTSHPYPGITLIKRTDQTTNPTRQVKMNIVIVDLAALEVRFKMTPPTPGLPGTPGNPPAVCVPQVPFLPWPCPAPPMEVIRRPTLGALEDAHAQVAINSHFFAPFPVVNTPQGQAQAAFAYLIGLAASRGNVYSAFETPIQNYAIMADSPAVNIDRDNHASIVHRDPADSTGLGVIEHVTLWNALSGSGQIITNGVKSIPCYLPLAGCSLVPPGNANYSNSNSWYNLINARTAIGIIEDPAHPELGQKLLLFTVDVRPLPFLPSPPNPPNTPNPDRSQGMRVPEVADVLLQYGVYNALNLDGGGSTSMAMQDPADNVRKVINVSSDNPPRAEASNLAVYSDGIDPATTSAVSPAPNAYGWNNTAVTVDLQATDLRSGNGGPLPGWVDQIQYALAGAQSSGPQVVPGSSASVPVTAEGLTTVTYSATDAAGNDEAANEATVRLDFTAPAIDGLPPGDCVLWPPNHEMRPVAVVTASDALSGVAAGALQVTAAGSSPSSPDDVLVTPDGAGGFVVYLRAERRGNEPKRVYTITATATDRAGNARTATSTCVVPHDQGSD
jgi:Phosphodiester glycosidase